VGEPAFLGKEANEALGKRWIPAPLEDHAAEEIPEDDERLPLAAFGQSIVAAFL
jgi:hypothetical protein